MVQSICASVVLRESASANRPSPVVLAFVHGELAHQHAWLAIMGAVVADLGAEGVDAGALLSVGGPDVLGRHFLVDGVRRALVIGFRGDQGVGRLLWSVVVVEFLKDWDETIVGCTI